MLSAERQIDQLHHPAVPEPEAFICFLSFFFFFGEEQNAGVFESASTSALD